MAHEIKTPLTLIKGPMEKIMKKNGHAVDMSGNLKLMEKNTNRLLELTNQLLDFRKTETKGFSLSFVKTDISAIVEDMYNSFKVLAEPKNLIYQLKKISWQLSYICMLLNLRVIQFLQW